ncbi:MAG: WD40 repeat domain-containing protein [Planctomycetes bacterium]|nr:WD40 repeat domain-containing protein [Planctomycetota bacterium]
MRNLLGRTSLPLLLAATAGAQVLPYGAPSPAGFAGTLDSGGQVPFLGSPTFFLRLTGATNPIGGILLVGPTPVSIPVSGLTLLVDITTAAILPFPAPLTTLALPIPPTPTLVGGSAFVQAVIAAPFPPFGVGLTSAVSVEILPDPTPTRGYFGLQDFSFGANAPGQMAILDLTTVPPSFRATGNLGFAGNIGSNFSPKIAVPEPGTFAFALGGQSVNQFVRVFDVSSDPSGIVAYTSLGDIPVGAYIYDWVGHRECETTPDGSLLFVTSGNSSSNSPALLEVFSLASLPGSLPVAPVQSISFANSGFGPVTLDVSPDGTRLALLAGSDNNPPVRLYSIDPAAPTPLTLAANLPLAGFVGSADPHDVHFSPDGTLLFVSGGNGFFSVVDLTGPAPLTLINGGTWPAAATSSDHGSAVAVLGGTLVGVLGDPMTAGGPQYHLIDLNETSPTFGQLLTSFTTNPAFGNISNHRLHARGGIVVAIDGGGATVDCQMVDVIDLAQPDPINGFVSWRVKTPTYTNLAPPGLASIPRDFDLR